MNGRLRSRTQEICSYLGHFGVHAARWDLVLFLVSIIKQFKLNSLLKLSIVNYMFCLKHLDLFFLFESKHVLITNFNDHTYSNRASFEIGYMI